MREFENFLMEMTIKMMVGESKNESKKDKKVPLPGSKTLQLCEGKTPSGNRFVYVEETAEDDGIDIMNALVRDSSELEMLAIEKGAPANDLIAMRVNSVLAGMLHLMADENTPDAVKADLRQFVGILIPAGFYAEHIVKVKDED